MRKYEMDPMNIVEDTEQTVHRQTDGRLREKHKCIVMRIDEDSSAYSESFKKVECTNWRMNWRMDGQTDGQGETSIPPLSTSLKRGYKNEQLRPCLCNILLTYNICINISGIEMV